MHGLVRRENAARASVPLYETMQNISVGYGDTVRNYDRASGDVELIPTGDTPRPEPHG